MGTTMPTCTSPKESAEHCTARDPIFKANIVLWAQIEAVTLRCRQSQPARNEAEEYVLERIGLSPIRSSW
jgi:hypothetical protein